IAERDAIAIQVVHEAAAISMRIGGPAEAVHDPARRDPAGRQLPQFLDADRVTLRVAVGIEPEALDQLLGQAAACAFGEHGDLRLDVDAFGIAGFVRAVLRHAHVADTHAGDRAILVVDGVGGGETGEYVHAERFGLPRQPGSRASSGCGSITAPDRICAPIVEAFSMTHTLTSGLSCFRRIANDRPDGPAPTTTTSYSMVSRSLMATFLGWYGEGRARCVTDARYPAALSGFAPRGATRAASRLAIVAGGAAIIGAGLQGEFMNSMPPIADIDLRRASLCQLLHWLAAGRVQPEALADVYQQAIERLDPQLNCYVDQRSGLMQEQAHMADRRRR